MWMRSNRRNFFGQSVGVAATAGLFTSRSAAAGRASVARPLPQKGNFVFRNAYVISMDPLTGDIPAGDVHVRDGVITGVGVVLSDPSAKVIDCKGMILMPGLVETHWHMWDSLMRAMAGDELCCGVFPTQANLGKFFTPRDMYVGARLAAAEAINAGITTVHDWCHNPRTPEHANEDLRALRESGIRGRFSYGPARGIPVTETNNLEDIRRLHKDWNSYANDGLLTLGLAWRGVQYAVTEPDGKMAFQPIPAEVYRPEYDLARSLGIPITAHCNIGWKVDVGHVAALDKLGLLYEDLQLVHMVSSTPAEVEAVAKAKCKVAFTPYSEMRTGFGFPNAMQYIDAGVTVGLGIDNTMLSGDANMFEVMKGILNISNGQALSEYKMPARQALELGTLGGAKALGLGEKIGSLTVGKRADMILIDTRNINIGMLTQAAHTVVLAAQPSNVSMVMVDGRILKAKGKLTVVNTDEVINEAAAANAAVRIRARWKY